MLMIHTYLRVFSRHAALIFNTQHFIFITLSTSHSAYDGAAHGPRE